MSRSDDVKLLMVIVIVIVALLLFALYIMGMAAIFVAAVKWALGYLG